MKRLSLVLLVLDVCFALAGQAAPDSPEATTIINEASRSAPEPDPKAPVPPVAGPRRVQCCIDEQRCFETASMDECYLAVPSQPAPEPDDVASFCAHNMPSVSTRKSAFQVRVHSCEEPAQAGDGELKRGCWVSEVAADSIEAAVVRIEWPLFSRRPERGHPNYREPEAGAVYWIDLDSRPAELTVEAAELSDGRGGQEE